MTVADLQSALESLSSERLELLVDQLERDPAVKLTIGAWRPQCPMVLAGFEPIGAPRNAPEYRFAAVWDRLANAERQRRLPVPWDFGAKRVACRADAQRLLHGANHVLARRAPQGLEEALAAETDTRGRDASAIML